MYWTKCFTCHRESWPQAMGKDGCDKTRLIASKNIKPEEKKQGKDTNERKLREESVFVCL